MIKLMHTTFFHMITWYPSKYSFRSLEKGSVHFCYYVRVKGSAWHRSLSSVLKSQRWAAMPHFTRRAVPPGLARHPGRRGTRFVGEAGSPGKAGSPRNRARRGTGIKVKNVVRAQSRWLIVAYAWPAQQTWSRYWDAYPSVWKTLYPSVWSTSLSDTLCLQWIYPALSCEFFSFICIHITSPGNRHWLTSPVRNCSDLGRSNNEIRRRMRTHRVHDAHCRRSWGIVHIFSYR